MKTKRRGNDIRHWHASEVQSPLRALGVYSAVFKRLDNHFGGGVGGINKKSNRKGGRGVAIRDLQVSHHSRWYQVTQI